MCVPCNCLAVADGVDDNAGGLDDGRAGEVAEGCVRVVLSAQGLAQAPLICLLVVEGEGQLGCQVLGGFLVPLLADHHIPHACVLAALSSLFPFLLDLVPCIPHPLGIPLLLRPRAPAGKRAGLLNVRQLSSNGICLLLGKLFLNIVPSEGHGDKIPLTLRLARRCRPHTLTGEVSTVLVPIIHGRHSCRTLHCAGSGARHLAVMSTIIKIKVQTITQAAPLLLVLLCRGTRCCLLLLLLQLQLTTSNLHCPCALCTAACVLVQVVPQPFGALLEHHAGLGTLEPLGGDVGLLLICSGASPEQVLPACSAVVKAAAACCCT
mmetsp:Transcript_5357/g.11733  ORF Transcript_5357/g.11733 Transcript_5357/m.11733 type:complete len:321 (+) Transcript_5357:502-1464(+)